MTFVVGESGWYKVSNTSNKERFGKVLEIKSYKSINGPYNVATIKFEDNSIAYLKETKETKEF